MFKRSFTSLYRLTLVMSTGMLVGQGCAGPDDLRREFLASFNSAIFRVLESGVFSTFSQLFPDTVSSTV